MGNNFPSIIRQTPWDLGCKRGSPFCFRTSTIPFPAKLEHDMLWICLVKRAAVGGVEKKRDRLGM